MEEELSKLEEERIKLENEKTSILEKLQPYQAKFSNRVESQKLEERLGAENQKNKVIIDKESEILRIKEERDKITFTDKYKAIFKEYELLKDEINLKVRQTWGEESQLKLEANSIFDSETFIVDFGENINLKSYLSNQFPGNGFDPLGDKYIYNNNHISNIDKLIKKAISDEQRFSNFKSNHTTEDLLRSILKDYFIITYDIVKGDDSLLNMSEGKKGIVILQMFLSLSNAEYPILIDQPEDNLDNRTVYKELNDYIKKCKIKRQIIIISHNANLVVNTDAENIIVANQSGEDISKENRKYRFEYVNGSLEKSFSKDESIQGILYQQGIRQHVCDVLEGGIDAFIKREKKYNL